MITTYIAISNKKSDLKILINLCLNSGISFEVLNGNEFYVHVYDDLLKQGYYNSIISKIEPAN